MFKITPKLLEEISPCLLRLGDIGKPIKFNKYDIICREGDESNHLFYMTQGLVKCYQLYEGKEVILRLMTDNSAVLPYSAFITGNTSSEYIECLQPCEGIQIALSDIETLRKTEPDIESVLRYMAEQHYLSMERRLIMLHHKSTAERYQYFRENMEPKIVEETPKQSIASYLGTTPESFSRMLRKLTK